MSKIKRSIKPKSTKVYNISVVIVCRNGMSVTKKCIDGVLKIKFKEIIVVDNDSTDQTVGMLKKLQKLDKRVHIVQNQTNNGFAEANNQGYEISTGKYILFLNNDTVIKDDFIPPLLQSLTKENIAAVQPMILFPDGTIDSIGSYLTSTGFLYHRAHRMKPNKSFLKHEPVYSMKGACMLWKREVLEEIGVFDESYFAYFEETDLCHRAINAGYQVVVNPESSIIHLGGYTSNSIQPNIIQFHNTKNRVLTYFVRLPISNLLTILPIHLLLTKALILKTALSGNISLAWAMEKGLLTGFFKGLFKRLNTFNSNRNSLDLYMKHPDIHYYKALFSSLQGYSKVW